MKVLSISLAAVIFFCAAVGCAGAEYSVAKSGGGVALLPLGNDYAMDQLQGRALALAPRLELLAPLEGQTLEGNSVAVSFTTDNYYVGKEAAEQGKEWFRQHVHVILDNKPYKADYNPTGSIVFSDLAPGSHTLTVFFARNFHLSLKNRTASQFVTFHVGTPTPQTVPVAGAPTLIYSRPKGNYSIKDGSAQNIMLDFYLFNVPNFGMDHFVRYSLDGGAAMVTGSWNPAILGSGLSKGVHTVVVELVDAEGHAVPGLYNKVERTFTVVD